MSGHSDIGLWIGYLIYFRAFARQELSHMSGYGGIKQQFLGENNKHFYPYPLHLSIA